MLTRETFDATERLRALFAPDGPLKPIFPAFSPEDQLNLALNIMAQLRSGSGQLVVEAGTAPEKLGLFGRGLLR